MSTDVATAAPAADSASNPAYAAENGGAWKGQYDSQDSDQNPPGTDNGGTGFGIWDFSGGYYDSKHGAPYGRLNHFIDGVDFPHSTYNDLGGPAFGLTNFDGLFATTTATRPFATPMSVGDTFSVKFDTPATYNTSGSPQDVYPFANIGFSDSLGQKTFDIEAGKNASFGEFPWQYDDATGTDVSTGIDPDATSDGSSLRFQLTSPTTGLLAFDFGGPDQQVIPISLLAGAPASVTFTLYSANTSPGASGEYEFFFNDLAIKATPDNEWQKPAGGNNDGNWGDATQWKNGVVPDGVDAVANFQSHPSLDGNPTITLEAPRTVGTINFDNVSRSYTLTGGVGGNGITLDVSTGQAQINVTAGSHVIDAPLTLADDTIVTVSPANASLSISSIGASAAAGLTKAGSGKLNLTGVNAYSGATTIAGGILNVATLANVNTPSSIGTGSVAGSAADLVLNGGTLQYTGASDQSTDRLFTIGTGATAATLDSSGAGAMHFTATGAIATTGTGPRTLTLTGTNTAANSFAPVVADEGVNATSLVKSGTGTWTITGANTYSGSTTIAAGTLKYGVSNTIPSGAGKGNVAVTGTLDLSGFDGTVNGLTGSGVVTNSGATPSTLTAGANNQTGTFTGTLSNTGAALALIKTGTGTLTLGGVNSYSGNTTVSAGTLKYAVNSAIPSGVAAGNVAVDGTLDLGGFSGTINGLSGSGTVTNTGGTASTITVGANDQTSTFAGTLSNGASSLSLVKIGTGTLTLGGAANTYTGSTTVSAGTLRYGANNATPSGSGRGNVAVNGTLDLNGFAGNVNGLTGSGTVTNSGGTAASISVGLANQTSTFAGSFSNSGAALSITKTGTGTLTLAGTSTHSGATTISVGTLKYGVNDALPGGAGKGNVAVNGTFDLNGFSGTVNGLSGSGSVNNSGANPSTITVGANDQTSAFAGTLSNSGGTLSLVKTGIGTLTLSGANGYSGNTTVGAGTLRYGANSTLPSGNGRGNVAVTGTLDLNGFSGTVNGLSGSGTVTNAGGNASTFTAGGNNQTSTFAGTLSNTGSSLALTKTGSGTLTLSGVNTYSGATTVNAGTLAYGVNNAIPFAGSAGNVTVSGTLDLAGFNGSINGLSGSGIVTNSGASPSNFNVGANAQTTTFAGTFANSGAALSLIKLGTGTLTLSGSGSTYSGNTTVSNGTLKYGVSQAIPSGPTAGNVVVNATLDMGGFNGNINGLSGSGMVTNTAGSASMLNVGSNAQTSTFNGTITNSGVALSLSKFGTGTLTLAGGPHSYSGNTTVSTGTLQYGVNDAVPSGTGKGNVAVNATLDLNGFSGTVNGLSGSGTVTNSGVTPSTLTAGANDQTSTFSGTLSNSGNSLALVKTGTGTLTLGGANTHLGGTTVSSGTLILANADALAGGAIDVANGTLARAQASLPKAVTLSTLNTNTSGKFDLTNNAMVIKGMDPDQVEALVQAGYNSGHWNGPTGLVSTTAETASPGVAAIGVANAGVLQKTSFKGVTLSGLGFETLVKYTYYGDSDLSGATTLDDFTIFLGSYQNGGVGPTWFQGDYDYSGSVTLDDFNLFLAGYRQQGAPLSAVEAMINSVPMSESDRAAMLAAVQAIPEPTLGVTLVGTVGGTLLTRRRRRHSARADDL